MRGEEHRQVCFEGLSGSSGLIQLRCEMPEEELRQTGLSFPEQPGIMVKSEAASCTCKPQHI